jgi:hypothetical protein
MQHPKGRFRSLLSPGLGGRLPRLVLISVVVAFPMGSIVEKAAGQSAASAPPPRPSLLIPEANRLPDANDQLKLNEARQKKDNFEAANALRQQQIDDETVKLLILAKDLKAQMNLLGDKLPTEKLLREAEVIELLAHDVQAKMTLTVKGT